MSSYELSLYRPVDSCTAVDRLHPHYVLGTPCFVAESPIMHQWKRDLNHDCMMGRFEACDGRNGCMREIAHIGVWRG
jgi:hypothetical protein